MNDPRSPNTLSELVDIKAFENVGDLQLINGYGGNGFRVSGQRYQGPVVLCPRQTLCWQPPEHSEDLLLEHIIPYLGDTPPPLFILGVGGAPTTPLNDLAASLKHVGIALELMSTAAACRTWNILMSEGRNAATGVYAVK